MKLPIDIFALLGVGLGTDAPGVLRALQKKIEKPAVDGLDEETLQRRKRILMRASKTLLEKQLREKYENDLKSNSKIEGKGFEVDEEEVVAGLVLLLEGGYSEECLQLGTEIQLKGGKSGDREREIEILLDRAALRAAEECKERRYYEKAANIIEMRLKNKRREFEAVKTNEKMEYELIQLTPYRILDLLSREDSELKRKKGIKLLEELIERRGGLDKKSNEVMGQGEFLSFFRQIRVYLTVQEQIDVFKKQSSKGSKIGHFLHGIALTASGFTQRKPEKLKEAIKVLENIRKDELETVIGNIYLLLGDIKTARVKFSTFAEPALKEWCKEITPESLGQICAWCEEWLRRDVLNGYKDLDTEADISAYFYDKDVVTYIEENDNAEYEDRFLGSPRRNSISNSGHHQENQERSIRTKETGKAKGLLEELRRLAYTRENQNIMIIIAVLTGTLALFSQVERGDAVKGGGRTVIEKTSERGQATMTKSNGVHNEYNEIKRIENTIAKWHKIKKERLAGEGVTNRPLDYISEKRLQELEKDADELQQKGRKMNIDVKIKDIKSIEQKGKQTIVEVVLEYGETIMNTNKEIIKEMPRKLYRRTYRLIKRGEGWVVD
jgi:hypothetical protein